MPYPLRILAIWSFLTVTRFAPTIPVAVIFPTAHPKIILKELVVALLPVNGTEYRDDGSLEVPIGRISCGSKDRFQMPFSDSLRFQDTEEGSNKRHGDRNEV